MSIVDVRQAIADTIKATLPKSVTVETHRGRFDSADEIKRFGAKAPAVLVACIRLPMNDSTPGLPRIHAGFAIYVVTSDKPQLPRDVGALALVESIELIVSGNTWGRSDTSEPTAIDARNLYSGAVDRLGVALWAVTFDQVVANPVTDEATLAVFATFHQDVDIAPADGQIDITETDTLPQ